MAPAYLIGTSGWSYPSGFGNWRGIMYPPRWRGDELAYYAERFPAVEVNASFYRVPTAVVSRGWAQRTPDAFQFAVKLYRKVTHPEFYAREEGKSPLVTAEDVRHMRAALDPLAECGKLGAVLVQYPEFFLQTDANIAALVHTLDAFSAYPLAVELRHPSWDSVRAQQVLTHFAASRVRLDEPCYQNLAADYPAGPVAYWRFHGRNATAWRAPGSGSHRYDYCYSAQELGEITEFIQQTASPSQKQFVFFNNHVAGQAVANALALAANLNVPLPFPKFANLAVHFPALRALTGAPGGQLRMIE